MSSSETTTDHDVIRQWIEQRGGEPHLVIPDHLGYPITAERLDRALRA